MLLYGWNDPSTGRPGCQPRGRESPVSLLAGGAIVPNRLTPLDREASVYDENIGLQRERPEEGP